MIDLRHVGYTSTGEEDPATPIEDVIDVVRARWDDIARIEIQAEDTGDAFVSYPLGTQASWVPRGFGWTSSSTTQPHWLRLMNSDPRVRDHWENLSRLP